MRDVSGIVALELQKSAKPLLAHGVITNMPNNDVVDVEVNGATIRTTRAEGVDAAIGLWAFIMRASISDPWVTIAVYKRSRAGNIRTG